MSANEALSVLFPVGRLVQGSLYKPNTTDAKGNPLVYKSGPNIGQPRVEYFVAIAIPKTGEDHWAKTEWGQNIWNLGFKLWPGGAQSLANRPDFAWKIVDGDSKIPDKKNVPPCNREGFPGHWIVRASSGYAPKVVTKDGNQPIIEEVVKAGHYVQLYATVDSNRSDHTAGMYINTQIIAHSGYGQEITYGPDPTAVGFGQGALPAGASAVPLGGMTVPANGAAPPPQGAPPAPGVSAPPPGAAYAASNAPPPPGAAQAQAAPPPNQQFTAGAAAAPPPPGAPGTAPPPPGPLQRVMLPAAGGITYEAYKAANWTDEALIQQGMMAP